MMTNLERAIAYHKTVEGEYGCNGATCPGVQRLVAFLDAATADTAPHRSKPMPTDPEPESPIRPLVGPTPFHHAMNYIGSLIFDRGRRGDLDLAVSTRRVGPAVTISVYYADAVTTFTFTDDELQRDDERRTAQSARRKRATKRPRP